VSRGWQLLSIALPALALWPACLNEVGAKCSDDSNCPTGQFCSSGSCADGAGSDAGQSDGGSDAGPQAPIAGTVTLNGGFPEPATNTAWVLAWDHLPAGSDDAGIEDPQLIAQTGDGGAYAIFDAGVGTSYYLAVDYSIDTTGILDDGANRFDLFASPQVAGAPGCDAVTLDAQTSACIAWSLFDGDTDTTSIVALIADIPDVTNGDELATNDVQSATATDPNGNNYELNQISGTGIPSELNGKYAYYPLGTAPPAEGGNYHFVIKAQGYPKGICDVQHQPLTQAPVIADPPNPWVATVANEVSWTSAPGTEGDSIEIDAVESNGTEGPELYESTATSPWTVPAGSCPVANKCRLIITSFHSATEGLRALSIASASSSDIIIGQAPDGG
jgi:hypothetical protein